MRLNKAMEYGLVLPTDKSWPGQARMTQVRRGWLTLRRAEFPFANNPPVYPGAQQENKKD